MWWIRVCVLCIGLLAGLLRPCAAGVEAIDLMPPHIVMAFPDSLQVAVCPLPGLSADDIDALVQGRARLELERTADAAAEEISAAISCLSTSADLEAILVEAIPSTRVVGPGTAYFQVTANLVEYRERCATEEPLAVILWVSREAGSASLLDSILAARLLYDGD